MGYTLKVFSSHCTHATGLVSMPGQAGDVKAPVGLGRRGAQFPNKGTRLQ
jgi:hypothetical protein